ncbi:MAG TPA: hypothetical protein VE053_07025 [Allosphingosinicella sp.]|nr:hypothetical protein [Allosphingosinicella sp.]
MNLELMERPTEGGESPGGTGEFQSFRESLAALADVPATVAGGGDSIYEQRMTAQPPVPNYDLEPYTVYFYYIRLDTDGRLTVKHYTRPSATAIPHASLQQVVQEMVDNVRNGDNAWASDGRNFANILWTRKSYIAFFIDEDNWDLNKNGSPYGGVRFIASPTPNHSFYDAVDLKATVVNRRSGVISQRSAIAFVNHMKRNDQGDDLVLGDRQTFKFEMIFDVKFADLSTAPLVVIFDPEGTNLGPPVSPP